MTDARFDSLVVKSALFKNIFIKKNIFETILQKHV